MRHLVTVASCLSLLALGACGDNQTEQPPAAATASAVQGPAAGAIAEVLARFGGILVQAQRNFVEVLPRADGSVQAAIYDDAGNPMAGGAGATLVIKVKGGDGEMHPVQMAWNAEQDRYIGTVGADIEIVSGPVQVQVAQGGQTSEGQVDAVAVVAPAQYGGTMVLAGDVAAEFKADANGEVAAVMLDVAGQPILGEAGVTITANVDDAAGASHEVTLAWNAEEQRYVGSAGIAIVPGPMRVVIGRGGRRHVGRIAVMGVVRAPTIEGEIVVAGDHTVELAPAANGQVQAVLLGADGVAVQGQAGVSLTVNVGVGAARRPVVMVWDPALGRYKGQVEAGVDVRTTPIEVAVVANGRRRVGRFGRGLALGHYLGRRAHGGTVAVEGPGGTVAIEGPRGGVVVQGAAGGAVVRGPRGGLVVQTPQGGTVVRGPRGGVVVQTPEGNTVVRGPRGNVVVQQPGGGVVIQGQQGVTAMVRTGAAVTQMQVQGGVSIMGSAGGALNIGQ